MGACLTYTAVRHGDPDTICERLHLQRTGERGWLLDADFSGIELPLGWYVIITNRSLRFIDDSILSALSADTTVLSCFLEEHVMYSTLSTWENGKETWSLTSDCNNRQDDLEQTGVIPAEILTIAQQHIAKQRIDDGVDHLFDAPIAAMAHYTGLRHDRSNSEIDDQFESLKLIRTGFMQWLVSFFTPNKN